MRRCIYYYLKFPNTPEELEKIVEIRYKTNKEFGTAPTPGLVKAAVQRFLKLRDEDKELFKLPGTSELLDWLHALQSFDNQPYPHSQLIEDSSIPYPELLFKLRQDFQKYAS